ncbi:YqgE/AlgH family protein [Aureliella helgolandensis]|uniref:Uncharacterized protein n=1 Tax=Aureliella helgolandensis TaxID=2527968 RepID=A0A518G5W5_9BACT|nr:YqgE/AlgH family protein [Aureliella helgolandensis]QDV23981.1 hypothetical protein Q31a_22940 [Aureliella helgolandensis]
MDSIQGRALVASPYLNDPNFLRSVVYVLQHDEEGAFGLVLNRPTQATIGELMEQLGETSVVNDANVYWGGPVDGPLMLLQEAVSPSGDHAIFAASDQAKILKICVGNEMEEVGAGRYRIFDGYAGWGAEQLNRELKSGDWLLWDVTPNHIFTEVDELWESAIKSIGRDVLAGGIDRSRIPEDPAFN